MYVLIDENQRVLAKVTDLTTSKTFEQFLSLAQIDCINSYRNKIAEIKRFWVKKKRFGMHYLTKGKLKNYHKSLFYRYVK